MPKLKLIPKQSLKEMQSKSEDLLMDLHTFAHATSGGTNYVEELSETMNVDMMRHFIVLADAALYVAKHYSFQVWLRQQEADTRAMFQKRMLKGGADNDADAARSGPASKRQRVRLG